jgi:hypothetical protein
LLGDGGADRAWRCADHRRRFPGKRVGAIWAARPVDRILQPAYSGVTNSMASTAAMASLNALPTGG